MVNVFGYILTPCFSVGQKRDAQQLALALDFKAKALLRSLFRPLPQPKGVGFEDNLQGCHGFSFQ
jgi:hypothetical protein